jgi:hypothetical protein
MSKPMRTPLTPTRLARSKALIHGYGEERAERALRDMFLGRRFYFLDLLTDEAVEKLAFRLMSDRVNGNKFAALNRAIRADIPER